MSSESDGIRLDFTNWPVVLVMPPMRVVSDAELETCMSEFSRVIDGRKQPYAVVVDLRESSGLTPTQRQRISNSMGDTDARVLAGYPNCGGALVFSSAFLRGMLTAILWIRKPKHETRVFANPQDAILWARVCVQQFADRSGGDRSLQQA